MDYVSLRRSQLQQNGFALSKTYGKSMRPLLWGGQHCVVVVPLEGEPAVGDLLMFKQTGQCKNIVHRLVEIRHVGERCLYITRGDNCMNCEKVSLSEIIGRVAEVHRTSGFRPWHAITTKQFAVTDPAYLRYSHCWATLWPVRRLYYWIRAHAYGLRARLLSILNTDR